MKAGGAGGGRSAPELRAAAELALVVAITLGPWVFHRIPVNRTLAILALGWWSLRVRRVGWKGVGLARPSSWRHTVATGVATGVLLQALSEFVTGPLLSRILHSKPDLSLFRPIVGHPGKLLWCLALVWMFAAFGEEMAFRGYVLNRAAELGGGGRLAWAVALPFASVLFGMGHSYQGAVGMVDNGLYALALGGVYLACGRNLWVAILAHGTSDTIALGAAFLGHL
ncbi:MAG TPA: CPBP family intramembrane glutamic endopeptidase [Planctomycetota bacterium]|jgi:hypothetical protein|nr:CPBP family intramembrane glutamic endopeptidase [Planctomycetota bacterium]